MDWKEVKVKYVKQLEDGSFKSVSELYLFDAVCFTEAEERASKKFEEEVRGEFSIEAITKRQFEDVFRFEDSEDWYKCKVVFLGVNEDSGREKKITKEYLLTSDTSKQAIERLQDELEDSMMVYEIPEVKKTSILEVIPYVSQEVA